MKLHYDRHVREAPVFAKGEPVWLHAENLTMRQPSKKLCHKRIGPFKVVERVGELAYRLELPATARIHPVFHVSLLSEVRKTYRKTPNPPPIDVEGELEYEVEEILDSRKFRGELKYLVKWKGYDPSHNSWESVENVANAPELVADFHRKHPSAPRRLSASLFKAITWKERPDHSAFTETPERWEEGKRPGNESRRRFSLRRG